MATVVPVSIRDSLSTRLLKIVFSIYFVITLTVTLIHMTAEYYNARESVIRELMALHKTFEQSLATASWEMNQNQLQSMTVGLENSPIVEGVKFKLDVIGTVASGSTLDDQGNLVRNGSEGQIQPSDEDPSASDLIAYPFEIMHKHFGEVRHMGSGVLYSSSSVVFQKVKYGFAFILVNAIIKTLALWIIFLLVGRMILSRPLARFTDALEKITPDEFSEIDIQTTGNNELKVLEQAFNSMMKKLFLARKALKSSMEALANANRRLDLLLHSSKDISTSYDKFTCTTKAMNSILQELSFGTVNNAHLYFQEQASDGSDGFAYFRLPKVSATPEGPDFQLESLKHLDHEFYPKLPDPVLHRTPEDSLETGCFLSTNILSIPVWHNDKLLGWIDLEGINYQRLNNEDKSFIDSLAYSLAISLENLGFTMELERKIIARTRELQETLHQIEQQNTSLLASNRKLEDLNDTKEKLLQKLSSLRDTHVQTLKDLSQEWQSSEATSSRDIMRQVTREIYRIDETLRPITSRYISEQAIQSKRVLLAEANNKQQIIAKMALRGTGVELDIVSNLEQGYKLLNQQMYDIVCVDRGMIELGTLAQEKSKETQCVFMTSENTPSYLPILINNPFLSNIVSRNEDDRMFTLKNILTTVSKLVNHDLFGLEKYLSWGVEVRQNRVTNSVMRHDLVDEMERYLQSLGVRRRILSSAVMVAEELLMNAIYDAPSDSDGKPLYNHLPRTTPVVLKPEEQAVLRYACDGLLLAVSVEDPFGMLTREIILKYLQSCYGGQPGSLNENQPAKGGAGRGLFQIMETSDLLVMNVKPQVKTEIIGIFNVDPLQSQTPKTTSFHFFYG